MGKYVPTIDEGLYPLDAGWTEEGSKAVLLLCIPELDNIVHKAIEQFDYAWLFDESINAYIFCFRIDEEERAIIFQFEHAGKLLLDAEAYEPFCIAITSMEFHLLTEHSPYVMLQPITLNRQPIAGW